jgi:hypothetical protein
VVVAIWAVLNGLLVAMLAGFGESYFVLQLYGSAAAFVLVLAGLVWLGRRYRPWQRGWRQPAGTGSVALFAIGVMVLWLGLAFGMWVAILSAFPFVLALILEISVHASGHRERVRSIYFRRCFMVGRAHWRGPDSRVSR